MATGVTSSITSNVSFESHFQLTKEDDTLIISGAIVTMLEPQGDIFTDKGNDVVRIENSTIITSEPNLEFMLGSGDDTLTVINSVLSAPISMGSGDDTIVVDEKQVELKSKFSFGSGNDTLELNSVLNASNGTIDFGSGGQKTLRFNGGTLQGTGTIGSITNLDVLISGGTIKKSVVLSGEQTKITLNGNFVGGTNIFVSNSNATLELGKDVYTDVEIVLNNTQLVQTGMGVLEFTGDYGIDATDSIVVLHDILGHGKVGINAHNASCTVSRSVFSTGDFAFLMTEGTHNLNKIDMSSLWCALYLSSGTMSGSELTFRNNSTAMRLNNSEIELNNIQASNNRSGTIDQTNGNTIISSALFESNYSQNGAVLYLNGGIANITNAVFSDNHATSSGGAIFLNGGALVLTDASFLSNGAISKGQGGGLYIQSGGTATLTNVDFNSNSACDGGAIFLSNATLNYIVTSGKTVSNIGNRMDSNKYGGWLFAGEKSAIKITIENEGLCVIGDENGADSIAGHYTNAWIAKDGLGYLLINSDVSSYAGRWSLLGGTLELARISRTINLDNWSSFQKEATLILSNKNDTINMSNDRAIGTLDLGGGSDTINITKGQLTTGKILIEDLTINGGLISAEIENRNTTKDNNIVFYTTTIDSNYMGNEYKNTFTIEGKTRFNGKIDLAGGNDVINAKAEAIFTEELALGTGTNSVYVRDTLTANSVRISEGGETTIYVYYGATLTNNTLSVYSELDATRDTFTLDWSKQTDLDKVRILISTDSSFDTYEFAVELYNQSKSFTLNMQQGYFVQFQANDEDGWEQRLLDDTVAPNQVTGVSFSGKTLSWDQALDNLGGNGVSRYHVEVSNDASFTTILQSETVTETEYTPTMLSESTLYFRVKAEDYTNNIGAWSETVSGMYDIIPPSIPSNNQSVIAGYSATLTWTASTDAGSGVSGYEYRIATDSNFGQIVSNGITEKCTLTVENLKCGTYYWQVRAMDASGNISDWSLSKSFATADSIAPSTPTNLEFDIENGKMLTVIWDVVSDDSLGSGLNGYEIQLADDSAFCNIVKTVSVAANSVSIDNLTNAIYYLRVCAIDNAGNRSAWTEANSFIIDREMTAPTVTNVTADITTLTNGNVTVTATFSDNVGVASSLYRIGTDGVWTAYENGVTVTDNSTVYFKAVDTSGNESAEVSYSVTNIDRTPPAKPTATADVSAPTKGNVTVTASFSEDSIVKEYSTNGQIWQPYNNPVIFEQNGMIYFRASDEAGNISEVTSCTVSNIDKVAPEKPTASANITAPTNQNVTVTATFGGDSVVQEYSTDGQTWKPYTAAVVLTANGVVSFRGTDEAGNISEVTTYEVTNIDKEPPIKPTVSADVTETTYGSVSISAVFSGDSVKKEYSLNNGDTWLDYTAPIVFTANGIVLFRGIDAADNVSEVAEYTVTNIEAGAIVSSGLVISSGRRVVSANEVYDRTTVLGGGTIVLNGGRAYNTILRGKITSTSADGTDWFYNGKAEVSRGGILSGVDIYDYGKAIVYSGGTTANTNIFSKGYTSIYNGAIASNTSVGSGGHLEVYSGGKITGLFHVDDGASVAFYDGSILNFDLSAISPEAEARVILPFKLNVPLYTLTVSDSQAEGIYTLAEGAAGFDKMITLQNTSGESFGELVVGQTTDVNGKSYTLSLADNTLSLSLGNIMQKDTIRPTVTNVKTNISALTNQNVTVTADFVDDVELAKTLYRIGETNDWADYVNGVSVSGNTTVYFKAIDAAGNESEVVSCTVGNIDKMAPSDPSGLMAVVSDPTVVLIWNPSTDDTSGIKEYVVKYSCNGQDFTATVNNTNYVLTNLASGSWTWSVQAVDLAGNKSTMIVGNSFDIASAVVNPEPVSDVAPQTQRWEKTDDTAQYLVEYSVDNFKHVIQVTVDSNSLDSFQMPANYQMRVKPEGGEWSVIEPMDATEPATEPKLVKSNKDGNLDVFFANAIGTWEAGYVAQHVGSTEETWGGTKEYATVYGKNKLADIIEGSTDANILLMTDDANGDGLFVDDIYSALPGSVTEQQARIAQIDEIRAGAGNDIVDMTSQRFAYTGTGLTIRGGAGNDTIWANKGDNFLFGDAGNDRIVGASGNDVIVGGIGNDRMHGGGGDDIFTFCDNWGIDEVEQLAGGKVTLWFASGDESNWNSDTLTYTDGDNSVTVKGVISVELKFGKNNPADTTQFAALSDMGAFDAFTSQRIFEESGTGILA